MTTATLGGLIKDYRLRKRLSQLEVSIRIGWSDATRLSKIEQGRTGKPNRTTAEKIIKALELSEQEKGEFLFISGYLPTDEEKKLAIKDAKEKIDTWPYPAYLMDFSWCWLYTNTVLLDLIQYPASFKDKVPKAGMNFLEVPFLPKDQFFVDVFKGEDKEHLKPIAVAQIATFKTENIAYQNENWYKKIIKDLMRYEEFRKLWPVITQEEYHKKLFDYEYKRFSGVYDGIQKTFDFYVLTARVIRDPRFQVVLYYPAI